MSGKYTDKPFELMPWQREIISAIFGAEGGVQQYRKVYLTIGRKNGKSALAAGIAHAKHTREYRTQEEVTAAEIAYRTRIGAAIVALFFVALAVIAVMGGK